ENGKFIYYFIGKNSLGLILRKLRRDSNLFREEEKRPRKIKCAGKINFGWDCLPPVPRRRIPAARTPIPTAANPDRAGMQRITPMTGHPNPSAVPNPFAINPDIS